MGTEQRLTVVQKLLGYFDSMQLSYCHWKSNEHLLAAIRGDTDLDILFDEDDKELVYTALTKAGFLRFKTAWFVRYPHIEDFLTIDPIEGKIVHVHAHFRLILGEKRVKSYRLPWEKYLLGRRDWNPDCRIYVSNPTDEMLLLVIRSAIKIKQSAFGDIPAARETNDALREFAWLKNRVQEAEFLKEVNRHFCSKGGSLWREIYREGLDRKKLSRLRDAMAEDLASLRRISRIRAAVAGRVRFLFSRFTALNKRFNLFSISNHRSIRGDGFIVAVLGADGSGKSTQVARLIQELSKKLDARYIYMGSGVGPASWHRKFIAYAFRTIKTVLPRRVSNKTHSDRKHQKKQRQLSASMYIRALSLAVEKRSKLKKAAAARGRGAVVITDRYPQMQIAGFNDGMLLADSDINSSRLARAISGMERYLFSYSSKVKPDLVIKLTGDPDILHGRRADELTREAIVRKQEGIRSLKFSAESLVVEQDALRPIEQVTRAILGELGKLMIARALHAKSY